MGPPGGRAHHRSTHGSHSRYRSGSYGGFDLGGRRERTWEILAGLGYRFTDLFELRAGYKIYSLEFLDGRGLGRFGFDGNLQGLWLGFTFHLGDRGSVKDSKGFI